MTSVESAMPGTASRIRRQALEVVLDRVLAAHPAEHRVATRLDRQVERLAHRRAVAHRLDQPVRQVPRVRGHEAQPRDRGRAVGGPQGVDRADQLGEVGAAVAVLAPADGARRVDVPEARLGREVVAVAVDVLAEERDLAVARRRPRARASSTISSNGRLRSGPRLNGTMQ